MRRAGDITQLIIELFVFVVHQFFKASDTRFAVRVPLDLDKPAFVGGRSAVFVLAFRVASHNAFVTGCNTLSFKVVQLLLVMEQDLVENDNVWVAYEQLL
ncbi:hypothetical protein D3C79_586520 [compost metagenome]